MHMYSTPFYSVRWRRLLNKQHHEDQGTHTKQVRDSILEKTIFQALNISRRTVQSIVGKEKQRGRTGALRSCGCSPNLTRQAKRALVRESADRFMATMEELQEPTDQVEESVDNFNLLCVCCLNSGLCFEALNTVSFLYVTLQFQQLCV